MDEPKKAVKQKKSKGRKKPDNCSYIIEVKDWKLTYSFGLNTIPKLLSGQYLESLHLKLNGCLQYPVKYASKEIKAAFVGDRSLPARIAESDEPEIKPRAVGSITLWGEQREFLGVLPFDTLGIIDSLLRTKQIKFLDLYGAVPSRGHAYIESIRFLETYAPDDQ